MPDLDVYPIRPPRPAVKAACLAAAPLLLAIAGCSDAVSLTNASIADVAAASASLPSPQAGGWRSDATLQRFDAGHAKTPAARDVASRVGETTTTETCLAPDDARKPLFAALNPAAGSDCRFPHFRYRDAHLDAAMTCRNRAGETLSVTQKGRYSATAVDLVSTVVRTAADGTRDGGQQTHVVARRTGECAGAETAPDTAQG